MTLFFFSPHEIFEIIAKTEATVSKFYTHLAGLGLGDEASKVFRVLSEEEFEHEKIFLKMAGALKEKQGESKDFSMDLRKLLEDAIQRIDRSLLQLTPLDRQNVDFRQCIDIAIRHEKDSIKVYTELLRAMSPEFSDIFQKIVNIEKGHLKVLEDVLKNNKV